MMIRKITNLCGGKLSECDLCSWSENCSKVTLKGVYEHNFNKNILTQKNKGGHYNEREKIQ